MVGIRCPYCSHTLGGDASLIGCKAQCNRCQQKFYIKAEDIINVSAVAPDAPVTAEMPDPPAPPTPAAPAAPAAFAAEQVKAVEPAAPTDVEHYAGKSTADRAAEIMASDLSDEEVLAQLEREGIDIDNLTADEDNISSEIKVDLDAIAPPGSRSGINQTVNYILLGIAIAGALIFGTLFVVRFINRQALTDEAKAAEKAEYEAMEKKQNEKKAQQTSHANDPQNIEKCDAE